MKNDYDIVKKKIDVSGVAAPEDLDGDHVSKLLTDVEPKPVEVPKKPKRGTVITAVSAAAAVLVLAITAGVILRVMPKKIEKVGELKTVELSGGLALTQFGSYDEVEREVARLRDLRGVTYAGEYESNQIPINGGSDYAADSNTGSSGSASAGGTGSSSHNSTYTQVTGVDEGDIIKTDGKYLYCVNQNDYQFDKIEILSAEGENSKQVAEINVYEERDSAENHDPDKIVMHSADYCAISDIFLRNDRLIVICGYTDTESTESVVEMTRVNVYDIGDIEDISLLDSFSQSGMYIASRMIDDTVYLVGSYTPWDEDVIPRCGNVPEEIPADCIYGLTNPNDESFLVISAYDTLDHTAATESKAILGGIDDIYCNRNHLYVYATEWCNTDWNNINYSIDVSAPDAVTRIQSQILKVDLTDGICFTAYTEVDGVILSQYAMDEYNGNLRVATTSTAQNWTNTNNLFVLDENLNMIGSVTGFAETESIHAVRYIEDTAYVITYEQTDPLFVIDLSAPTDPKILGEVEITGFSTMLVPIDENTLLGIGQHIGSPEDPEDSLTRIGVKLALFDVSDKANPKVLDSKSYLDCYSTVLYNPRALVVNRERDDYVIPLDRYYEDVYGSSGDNEYSSQYGCYGGMLNFAVRNGKIVENQRYQSDHGGVERCAYVGDDIYMTYFDDDYNLQVESVPYQ